MFEVARYDDLRVCMLSALRVIRKTARKALKDDNVVATRVLPIGVTARNSRGGWAAQGGRGRRYSA